MQSACAMPPSNARRHLHLVNVQRLLRSLLDAERDAHSIVQSARLLAQSARPATAVVVALELEQLLPTLAPASEEAAGVRRFLGA